MGERLPALSEQLMQLIALKPLTYARSRVDVGASFEAGARDARLLMAVGLAKPADEGKPRRQYRRRDMQAEH